MEPSALYNVLPIHPANLLFFSILYFSVISEAEFHASEAKSEPAKKLKAESDADPSNLILS